MKIRILIRACRFGASRAAILGLAALFCSHPSPGHTLGDPYTNLDFGLGFGARNAAMGGAFIAVGDGLAAVASNPAGLARLMRVEFTLGAGYGGQAANIPAETGYWYDWPPILPPASAYDWNDSHASLRHAGLAASIRAGRQVFVLALSYHRELDFGASYRYPISRNGPYTLLSPDDPIGVPGTLEQTESYQVTNAGALDVITGSLAFRVATNVYFGLNLNFLKGGPRLSEAEQYTFVFTAEDSSVINGQGTVVDDRTARYSTAVTFDFGFLWVTELFSAGIVYRTGFGLKYQAAYSFGHSESRSDGTVYEDLQEHSGIGAYDPPAGWGVGFALHPTDRWNWSIEFHTSGEFPGGGYPSAKDQIRTGAEYLFPVKALVVPLRAGWFINETDISTKNGWAWLQGFTFGTGIAWKNLAWDFGAVLHFKSYDLSPFYANSLKKSYWDVVTSLTYRSGR